MHNPLETLWMWLSIITFFIILFKTDCLGEWTNIFSYILIILFSIIISWFITVFIALLALWAEMLLQMV